MPSIHLRLLLTGVVLASLAGGVAWVEKRANPSAHEAGLAADKLERLDALLQAAVDRHQIAGGVALLARHGYIGYLRATGWRDAEARTAMTPHTLFRIGSMTKPITAVAALMLVEDGKLRLDDPLSNYVPEFKEPKALAFGMGGLTIKPAMREITIHDLLTHTSGLSYRFWNREPLSSLYRNGGISDGLVHPDYASADNVRRLARQPLLFQPGSAWEYSLSTDVLGVVVEIVSGQDLASFFRDRIFGPLRMRDTFFLVPEAKKDRLAALYLLGLDNHLLRVGAEPVMVGGLAMSATYPCVQDGKYFSGGAGLVSTANDYARFLQMLLNGGELDGARLLQSKTVRRMTSNQIGELKTYLREYGDGFGYGVGVQTESGMSGNPASVGSYSWGGVFNTYFWVDPKKELIGILMTQVFEAGCLPLRYEFKKRAYECLADYSSGG
ncbi:MAG: serine hydrolase domain-containing protein [Gemmataceae bacterium]